MYTVSALDIDSGNNSVVRYSLAGRGSQSFVIDSETGEVRVSDIGVDFETIPENPLQLNVIAADLGRHYRLGSYNVRVKLKLVSHNSVQARPLHCVSVLNLQNTKICDCLTFLGLKKYYVNLITGIMFLKHYCTGFPQQISIAIINITVIDGNDNAPVFFGAPYSAELAEGTIGARRLILNVNASDVDSGINGVVMYSLAGGGSAGNFEIDSVTVSSLLQMATVNKQLTTHSLTCCVIICIVGFHFSECWSCFGQRIQRSTPRPRRKSYVHVWSDSDRWRNTKPTKLHNGRIIIK